VIVAARDAAESAAQKALALLAVDRREVFGTMSAEERVLRRKLRAKARQLGDHEDAQGGLGINHLMQDCAYEHWHRMLFARFLAENGLLMHSSGVSVSLEECADLAATEDAADGWELAARYASNMLPQIFRQADPILEVRFSREDTLELERLLASLPNAVFLADDSLGWVYQFWQTKRKNEVNLSEKKIGADELPAVTQLFTEDYMVLFLLHNTFGAWWVGNHPGETPPIELNYLRIKPDGTPAAGTFEAWPKSVRELKVLDPCCGSGHFLVAAFQILVAMLAHDEGLSKEQAADIVLSKVLYGLEIDPRCTQIAAFALAFAAWRMAGSYRTLPELNIACSGLSVGGKYDDWKKLARGDDRVERGLKRLYELFQQAPTLGSLIEPKAALYDDMIDAGFEELRPLLNKALEGVDSKSDASLLATGVAARGIATAATILNGEYDLVVTNVPYLSRSKQDTTLKEYCEKQYPAAKGDLATAFLQRSLAFCRPSGDLATVSPQNWLLLGTYETIRRKLLTEETWIFDARLGSGAFETITGEVVNVCLTILKNASPPSTHFYSHCDVSGQIGPKDKAMALIGMELAWPRQSDQLLNPNARILAVPGTGGPLLQKYADAYQGIATGDYHRFGRCFWELPKLDAMWEFEESTVKSTRVFGGMEHIIFWEDGKGSLAQSPQARLQGFQAHGKMGIAISQMGSLPAAFYTGKLFDNNIAAIVPKDSADLRAIWAFCSSPEFRVEVKKIDSKPNVTNATLVKVPFDFERWQKVAEGNGPLPEPYSPDPTQWVFNGDIPSSTEPLQVAVARLLGYRWPEQPASSLDELHDNDGVVCLLPIRNEQPCAERLRHFLSVAYGENWSSAKELELLRQVGFGEHTLEEWLRDGFFAQHTALFHHRPFIWHIWDGRKDGFSAFVNYHKLDRRLLDRLTHTYLGDLIRRQETAVANGESGSEGKLEAAKALQIKLKNILHGEPPYDIYVRWKALAEEPMGWEPDLNDGVRMNIRPFMMAGILRTKPNIKWNKDRGKDQLPDGSTRDRLNDLHFTLAEKRESREAAASAPPSAPQSNSGNPKKSKSKASK